MLLTIRRRSTAESMICVSNVSSACGPRSSASAAIERRLQLHELELDRGDDDLVLGLELVVDRRLRDADGIGDHLQRRAARRRVGEQVERRGDGASLGAVLSGADRNVLTVVIAGP